MTSFRIPPMRTVKQTAAAPRKRPTLYYNLDQIIDSGLLFESRLAELNAEIDARIGLPRTESGLVIATSRVVDLRPVGATEPRLFIYPRVETGDYQDAYMRREILNVLLTDEEAFRIHDYCSAASGERRNERLFSEAVKIAAADWDGWVTDGDRYHESVEAFLDQWTSDNQDWDDVSKTFVVSPEALSNRPTFLWAARPQVVIPNRLDVADVTEHYVTDRGWESMDIDDLEGVKELQAALDAFVEVNKGVVSYQEDNKTAILLDWTEAGE